MDHLHIDSKIGLEITIPAHICSECEVVIFEPTEYKTLLEAEEAVQGRPYVKVDIKNGKINKYSVH